MGIENHTAQTRLDYVDRRGVDYPAENKGDQAKLHEMDKPAAQETHRTLMSWFEQERERQLENRREMALDCDFYDGLQWSWEDARVLLERNQSPLVYNLSKPIVDWIIGSERRLRVDWRVLPRADDDVEGAGVKTKVLKYLSDVNKTPFQRSRAFEDTVKAGVGWLECGVRGDPGEEPIYGRTESWKHVWWDSFGEEIDQRDWRYMFRVKTLDLDIAEAFFPDRKGTIRMASFGQRIDRMEDDEEFWYLGEQYSRARDRLISSMGSSRRVWYTDVNVSSARRQRVRMYEGWYRKPMTVKIVDGGPHHGAIYDGRHPGVAMSLKKGVCGLIDRTMLRMRCGIFTENGMVYDGESPYRHNRFPFTPIWCYRRQRDGMPYGPLRNLRDPQEDFNKRSSKVLFILSSNRVIADHDAVDDHEDAREEAAKPNAYMKVKAGRRFEFVQQTQLADAHFKVAQMNMGVMKNIAGVNDDNLGRATNAESGEAIKARQSEGALQTLGIFDNKRLAIQLDGEKTLSLAEQFMTEPKVIRLTGQRGKLDWVKINQPEYDPQTGTVRFLNDITATMADFVVDEQDFQSTMREALFEEMMALISKLPPEVGMKFLDLAVDLIDIPGKTALVERIRKITGMSSPEDEQNPSPEKKAEMEAAARQQQEEQMLAREAVLLELAERAAKVQKLLAEVDKIRAEALAAAGGEPESDPEAQALREEVAGLTAELNNRRDEILADLEKHREDIAARDRENALKLESEERKHRATLEAQRDQGKEQLASKERQAKDDRASKERMADLDRRVKAAAEKAKAKKAKSKSKEK